MRIRDKTSACRGARKITGQGLIGKGYLKTAWHEVFL